MGNLIMLGCTIILGTQLLTTTLRVENLRQVNSHLHSALESYHRTYGLRADAAFKCKKRKNLRDSITY